MTPGYPDGETEFAFGEWPTPFENAPVHVFEVTLVRGWEENAIPQIPQRLQYGPKAGTDKFAVRLRVDETGEFYRIQFDQVSAFRVLDEDGLIDFWEKTNLLGGRPARTTFRVRNSLWVRESPLAFSLTDGWSYVIASDWDCVEIVAPKAPVVTLEVA